MQSFWARLRSPWVFIPTIFILIGFNVVLSLMIRTPETVEYVPSDTQKVATAVSSKNPEQLEGVQILSFTEMVEKSESNEPFTAVAVNPSIYAISVVDGDEADAPIYYSNYLPDSLDLLLAGFEAEGAQVTVAPTGERTIPSLERFGPDAGTAVMNLDLGGGFSPTMGIYLVFLGLLLFLVFRMVRGMGVFGGNKHTNAAEDAEGLATFADVAGCDEAIEDMAELVDYLKNPEPYEAMGARVPHGALLVGPPGTGKTLLARALAGEAGAAFLAVAGPDFVEKYVGVGAQRIRNLFKQAREFDGPVIIFIDEIDALGRRRSSGDTPNANTEQEGTLNALLVEMDGFRKDQRIIVIGATNREDVLDEALLRPGRLDRKITVGLPDRRGRAGILEVHARDLPLADDANLDIIARRTSGLSGADLEALMNEAALQAIRERSEVITQANLDAATATIAMGRARTSVVITPRDREITAWHEAGHAVCAIVQPEGMDVMSVSLLPRGRSGGQTWFAQDDDTFMTRTKAYAALVTGLGGMAAEQMLFNNENYTTGPSGDLQQCTNTALAMVAQYGMGSSLLVKDGNLLAAGAGVTDAVIDEAEALLRDALQDAKDLLEANRDFFDRMVEALLEYETLTLVQIEELREGHVLSAPPPLAMPPRPESPSEPTGQVLKPKLDKGGSIFRGRFRRYAGAPAESRRRDS